MFDLKHGVSGACWMCFLFIMELLVAFVAIAVQLVPLYVVCAIVGIVFAWYHNKCLRL